MIPGRPAHRDVLEVVGSVQHFLSPERYAQRYRRRREDIALYVDLAREHSDRVLEIGCGNGRVLLPIARAGVPVTGIERSPEMITALRADLSQEERDVRRRVSVRRADMRTFSLRSRYGLVICTFNTVLHLYDRADFERFLARVRAHLAPGGRLVFDAYTPRPRDLARSPERWLSAGEERERMAYEPLEQILYVTSEDARGERSLLAQRQWFPAEIEALLHYNRFEVLSAWPDFDRGGTHTDPDSITWVCTPAKR